MQALIVESNPNLGRAWALALQSLGADVTLAIDGDEAARKINATKFDVIVLNVLLKAGSALAISDLASFRQPEANVVFVTSTTFFSDGSIFRHAGNARALVDIEMPAEDIASIVHHYGVKPPVHAAHPE